MARDSSIYARRAGLTLLKGDAELAAIVGDRDSGAIYARIDGRLYPALNLASARLIAGRADNPHKVRSSQIAEQPHGPLVGIPGAPSDIQPTTPSSSSSSISTRLPGT